MEPEQPSPIDAVRGPSTALIALSATNLLSSIVIFVALAVGISLRQMPVGNGEVMTAFSGYVGTAFAVLNALASAVILVGALYMRQGRHHTLSMVAAVLALVPCTSFMLCCCCLGIFSTPFGIWALVVLSRPEVKAAFR